MKRKVNGYTVEFGNKHGDGSMAYIYENGELAYSKHGVMNESDFLKELFTEEYCFLF